jgi:serine protease AprX
MTRVLTRLAVAALLVAALVAGGAPARAAGAWIDPALRTQLLMAPAAQTISIANFDRAATSSAAVAAAIRTTGAGTFTFQNLDSVAVLATASQLAQVASVPGVTRIYANKQLRYFMPEANAQIGADRVWQQLGVTGKGIGVAILDSGIDASHPDLAFGTKTVQNIKVVVNQADIFTTTGQPATNSVYVEGLQNSDTSSGHGTHVAGIAAGDGSASSGYYNGVAPGANLIGIGTGDTLVIFWALAGFDYLISHRAQYNIKVVNNSWGSSGGAAAWDPNDPISLASKKAHDAGITVVFAAGNDGPGNDTMNPYAEAPWVIGVAAGCFPQDTTRCPDGLLADFSSRGVPGSAQFHPTLTAPGANIVSTRASTGTTLNVLDGPNDVTACGVAAKGAAILLRYTCASGTSMATPHVVGAVALMQERAAGALTPDRVKSILVSTAKPMTKTNGAPYAEFEVGAGYMDTFAAVSASR